jgi:hypothetical protein
MALEAQPILSYTSAISGREIGDASIHLLGRLLITRQQQADIDRVRLVRNRGAGYHG